MRIWYVCFIVGAAAALCGMGLGIFMGISHDFSLTPVHAHVNLLGWVTTDALRPLLSRHDRADPAGSPGARSAPPRSAFRP